MVQEFKMFLNSKGVFFKEIEEDLPFDGKTLTLRTRNYDIIFNLVNGEFMGFHKFSDLNHMVEDDIDELMYLLDEEGIDYDARLCSNTSDLSCDGYRFIFKDEILISIETPINTLNKKDKACICDSRDLFNFGCRCGYFGGLNV